MSTARLRRLLSSETERILKLSQYWKDTLESELEIPEDVAGRIRAHIGLSNLLVNDKLQQFAGLLATYESGTEDCGRKMTLSDLEGFWDLVYLQIDDTIKKFSDLRAIKQNNWEELPIQNVCQTPPPKPRLPLGSISNGTPKWSTPRTNYTSEARRRLSEAKSRVQQMRNIDSPVMNRRTPSDSDTLQENIPVVDDMKPNTAL